MTGGGATNFGGGGGGTSFSSFISSTMRVSIGPFIFSIIIFAKPDWTA